MDAFFGSFIGCSRDRKASVCLWSMNRVLQNTTLPLRQPLKKHFLASMQPHSALCTFWLYLLNCALKANAISQGRHLLGSQTHPHLTMSFSIKGKVLSVNATHWHNCTTAKIKPILPPLV